MKTEWMITGISSGIGKELATQLLEAGERVVGLLRHPEKISNLKETYPGQLSVYALDLCSLTEIEPTVTRVLQEHPDIFYVISNAGIGLHKTVEEASTEEILILINTNFTGTILFLRSISAYMKKKGGRLAQLSSLSAEVSFPLWSYYVASKHGINGFCSSMAEEWKESGAQLMLVEPGNVNTPLWNKTADGDAAMKKHSLETDLDVKRLCRNILTVMRAPEMPLYLTQGSMCNERICKELTARLGLYKSQAALAGQADRLPERRRKLRLPKEIDGRRLAFWPAGQAIKNRLKAYDWRELDKAFAYLVDADETKQDRYMYGRRILSSEAFFSLEEKPYVVITSEKCRREVEAILSEYGRRAGRDYCMIDELKEEQA